MRRFLDTRLARVTKAKAPRDVTEARQRALLRARAAVSTLLRQQSVQSDAGQALAGPWLLGDAAAGALAGIPDTPELRETDGALLARDHAGAEETFEARLWQLVQHYRDGCELDAANASPAELLAGCVCRGISASGPPAFPPPQAGEVKGGRLSRFGRQGPVIGEIVTPTGARRPRCWRRRRLGYGPIPCRA